MTLDARIADALTHDPSRPLLTWYDDATGERVELSVATTANWVAKTANLLRDTLDVQPGDRVVVALPRHWQTAVIHLATWLAGACVVALEPGHPLPSAPVAFVPASSLPTLVKARATEVVALSLRPLGGRLLDPPSGILDFAVEVPGHGDHFAPGPFATGPVAVAGDVPVDEAALLAAVERCGLTTGQRALVRYPAWTLDGLAATALAPLFAGAGVVLCAGDAVPPARLATERVTAVLG
ncbi:MAG TPA: TIGR03089 family protein [Mycobacteriales bacterium]|nr:TIGR03089 family protein [Mycobacteriales bacterium]